MTNRQSDNTRDILVARTLREAGYIPLPRLWVASSAMPEIKAVTERYRKEVNIIRSKVNRDQDKVTSPSVPDPRKNKEAAWATFDEAHRPK